MEKPLSRLERLKADKAKYPVAPVKKGGLPAGKPGTAPVKKAVSDKTIEAIARALQFMVKE